ncbi:DNA-processing protein DprA [Staphylococcus felis]|uniref:DNA-processing protein DprA n=1 Tax=Staphylococcus felis TaxID=46127 RepID=UPI0021D0CD4D|nr:DNA-processing protein DprA [Staphylococcus felis]UXR85953.1 DNA-processing protein DprA [Staphylococcus felis]
MQKIFLLLLYAGFSTHQIQKIERLMPNMLNPPYAFSKFKKIRSLFNHNPAIQKKFQLLEQLNYDVILDDLRQKNIKVVDMTSTYYPHLLKEIFDPPYVLFCKGNLQLLNHMNQTLSIVGARMHTAYTTQALEYLFPYFETKKLIIVSGLASGTDALAHQYALSHHLSTIGVLAFGHDHHYPQNTKHLRKQIEKMNLTVSEYPPHTPPSRYRFPERNRIISGVSKGVFVTEAKEKSGALITIDQALEQNRNVYVLPGTMFDTHTKGNLMRAKEGAEIVLGAADILKDYE